MHLYLCPCIAQLVVALYCSECNTSSILETSYSIVDGDAINLSPTAKRPFLPCDGANCASLRASDNLRCKPVTHRLRTPYLCKFTAQLTKRAKLLQPQSDTLFSLRFLQYMISFQSPPWWSSAVHAVSSLRGASPMCARWRNGTKSTNHSSERWAAFPHSLLIVIGNTALKKPLCWNPLK